MTSNIITPTVLVNGWRVPSRYGVQDLAVRPGHNRIEIHGEWLRRYGQATLDTTVASGQLVEVWYAAPLHQFTGGSIGWEKQRRRGTGVLVGFLGVAVLVLLLAILVAVLL